MHQDVLVGAEAPDVHPAEQPVLRENVGVPDGVAGAVLDVLVDIVAEQQVGGGAAVEQQAQPVQHLFKGFGVQPVVAVHHLVIKAGGVADALVDPFAVAAVLLMDGPDDGGVFGGVLVADGGGVVFGRAVVDQDDLGVLAGGPQGVDAVAHIGRRVIARHGKGDKLLFHNGTP